MPVAGCDVGSLTAKAAILEQGRILSQVVIPAHAKPEESARKVMQLALEKASLKMSDISFAIGTGYGRERIDFVNEVESEIVCHAKGAWWNLPSTRMVIDIGGQDAKAIRLDEQGKVIRYIYNDKCASGTGRFLEVMAKSLEIELEKMGEIGDRSTEKLIISNQCVIFAETEVVSLQNEGKETCDIVKALHIALANRVASLAKSIGVDQDIVMTGGVAKNSGVFKALSQGLNLELKRLSGIDPQVNGAIGAALLAEERV
ncbi:2-hydroxyglutaryl-CoA dehydratase [bacterium]|nr:2-hydroxyglutaryl-CoA dehydratase [bacterium]